MRDKLLLKELQFDFPVSLRPFAEIGERVGLSEDEVIRKIKNFKKKKIIKYAQPIFNTRELGLKSTLVAMRVPARELKRVVKIINAYPYVSHNYLRTDKFNLWFTLSAPSGAKLNSIIKEIKRKTSIKEALVLNTLKVFKIDTRFNL